jgi:hypothetical protein
MPKKDFQPGDPVVYRKTKFSRRPGPRAENIHPAAEGDDYMYLVDKFWVVVELCDDGKLLLRTRGGKEHQIDRNDPCLRHPSWWERLVYHRRFPRLAEKCPT